MRNNTTSKQSILTGLRFPYYPLNNNKSPEIPFSRSCILADVPYLLTFPFYGGFPLSRKFYVGYARVVDSPYVRK